MKALLIILAAGLALTACGRVGPPRPPGPADQITFPRMYPAPSREDQIAINRSRIARGLPPAYLIRPE